MTKHYLIITDGFDTEAFDLYGIQGDDSDTLPVEHLSQLAFFANLKGGAIQELKDCCAKPALSLSPQEYIDSVSIAISASFGESAANIVSLEAINSTLTSIDDDSTVEAPSTEQIRDTMLTSIDSAVTWACVYSNLLSDFYEDDIDTQHIQAHILVSAIPPDIRYIPIAAINRKTQKITYCNAYYVSTVRDFFTLMAIFAIKEDKPIRKCKNCDQYFIPISKRDEIYCLSCRDVSYDQKIKEDEILSSYRKIYKTQSARKTRNAHRPHINEKFEHWKHIAKSKRNDCKNGLITLEEMEKAISSQDWLDGNGGTNGID